MLAQSVWDGEYHSIAAPRLVPIAEMEPSGSAKWSMRFFRSIAKRATWYPALGLSEVP